jgi:hypothetical protein
MSFAQDDDVVEQLSPNGADYAFGERVLPRRAWRAQYLLDSEGGDGLSNEAVEAAVSVTMKKASGRVEWEGVQKLPLSPCRGGMLSDVEVADAAAAVVQDDEAVEDPERS